MTSYNVVRLSNGKKISFWTDNFHALEHFIFLMTVFENTFSVFSPIVYTSAIMM